MDCWGRYATEAWCAEHAQTSYARIGARSELNRVGPECDRAARNIAFGLAAVSALPEIIKRVRWLERSQRSEEPHEAAGVGVDEVGPFQVSEDGRCDADAEYVIRTLVARVRELEAKLKEATK